jgi:hypothetical protein
MSPNLTAALAAAHMHELQRQAAGRRRTGRRFRVA